VPCNHGDVQRLLRSKREVAFEVLRYDLCYLIQSTCQLWIVATFWKRDEPTPEAVQKVINVTPITRDEAVHAYV
jgi:hypothetical protein